MKKSFFIISLLITSFTYSQEGTRGAISTEVEPKNMGVKKALIIGISDYQEKSLQLNYADNDAVLFKNYLIDVENLPKENIQLLINQQATSLHIIAAFKSLLKSTKSGDVIYIYFAGHGDVVDDFGEKEGFLLAFDANSSQEYYSGGVIPLSLLNNKIINAFVQKGASISLVLDACRSGFIFEESTQKNVGTIQAMFENTTKFLSCGPNELSYESSDLKHGYFTYFLVKGLLGDADINKDKNLQYREIDDYLYNKVAPTVTQKHKESQNPIVRTQNNRANIREQVTQNTNFDFSSASKEAKQVTEAFKKRSITSKKELSPKHKEVLAKFNTALNRGDYYGKSASALTIFQKAKQTDLSPTLLEKMKLVIINKLSTSAQNLVNNYINGKKLPLGYEFTKQAKHLGICLQLLDEDNFLKNSFLTNKLLLEAYATLRNKNHFGYRKAKNKLNKALQITPKGAYIHNALGLIYNAEERYDSAHYHFNKAKKLIGSWKNPILNLSKNYLDQYKYEDAKNSMKQALGTKGSQLNSFLNLAKISETEGKYHEAEKYYTRALSMDTTSHIALQRMSTLQDKKGNIISSLNWLNKAMKSDSLETLINYGILKYINDNKLDKKTAENIFIDILKKKPNSSIAYTQYADFLRITKFRFNRNKLVDSLYTQALKMNPLNEKAYVGKAKFYLKLRKKDLALKTFNDGISKNKFSPLLHYEKANFYIKAFKDYKKATEAYHKALEIDEKYLPAHTRIININNQQQKYQESIAILTTLLEKNSEVQDLWNLLGDTYYFSGDYNKAIESYKKAIILDESYAKSFKNLANSQVETNQFTDAKKNYQLAISYNPKNNKKGDIASFITSMAKEQVKFGTVSKAKELYTLAFEINPSVTSSASLSSFLYANNQPNEAISIASAYINQATNKTEKIILLEVLVKSAIDIGNINICNTYYKPLLSTHRTPDYLLAAVYSNFLGDKKGFRSYLKKVNPEFLKINKLKGKYSKQTIQNYIVSK